jgi:hypothetical protein
MSNITEKDLERVNEPCKSCPSLTSAHGSGKNKKFYCKDCNGLLMDNPDYTTFSQLPDCPKRKNKS